MSKKYLLIDWANGEPHHFNKFDDIGKFVAEDHDQEILARHTGLETLDYTLYEIDFDKGTTQQIHPSIEIKTEIKLHVED